MKILVAVILFASSVAAQSLGVKGGVVFSQATLQSDPAYSFTIFAGFEPSPFQLNGSVVFLENRNVFESYVSAPARVYSGDFDIYLVPGLGMSWIDSFNINGIEKLRNAGLFRLDFRLLDDGIVFDLGYKFSRVTGTNSTYANSFALSWGFFLF